MASTPNSTKNVSYGKFLSGGYFFLAPAGTTLPTDNTTALDAAFLNMGFLGDDGVNFSDSSSTDNSFDANGDAIATGNGEVEKTFTVTFREIKADNLKVLYGSANVTDADGTIKVVDKGPNSETYVGVFEIRLKDGRKWRRVVPQCQPGELGDQTIVYNELVGREVTMTALLDAEAGGYYVDDIDSTETEETE